MPDNPSVKRTQPEQQGKQIHIYFHVDPVVVRVLERIERAVNQQLETIMANLDTLKAEVARNTTVSQSAIALLKGIKEALDKAIEDDDPQALQDLSDQLGSDTNALASAISENTPAANR